MGKSDPMKGNAGDYAKKAQQKRGVQDPLSDLDMTDEEMMKPQPVDPKGPQRTGRPSDEKKQRKSGGGQQPMDDMAEDRWDT
jgi:hypothetical protein